MSTEKKKQTTRSRKQDPARMTGGPVHELGYAARKTKKSRAAVKKAVKKVGNSKEESRAAAGPLRWTCQGVSKELVEEEIGKLERLRKLGASVARASVVLKRGKQVGRLKALRS